MLYDTLHVILSGKFLNPLSAVLIVLYTHSTLHSFSLVQGVKSIAKLTALQSINLTRSSALQSTIRTVLDGNPPCLFNYFLHTLPLPPLAAFPHCHCFPVSCRFFIFGSAEALCLSAARSLRSVTLAGTSCTDAAAENLAQLQHLNKLDISNTAIGDTGITKVPIEVLQHPASSLLRVHELLLCLDAQPMCCLHMLLTPAAYTCFARVSTCPCSLCHSDRCGQTLRRSA